MGRIISTKRSTDGLTFEIEAGFEETGALKGHYNDIYMFSGNVAEFNTDISTRGKNSATKYFLIPRHIRSMINSKSKANCQCIENEDSIFLIYKVDKIGKKAGSTK